VDSQCLIDMCSNEIIVLGLSVSLYPGPDLIKNLLEFVLQEQVTLGLVPLYLAGKELR
jgi:hypothetical protein